MKKRYAFTGETKTECGVTLRRIIATDTFTLKCGLKINKGDVGGWIEKEENLSDNAWVWGDAIVRDNAKVCDNAIVRGNAKVCE